VQAPEPELTYAFKHALTQEAPITACSFAAARVPWPGRQALELLYPDRLDDLAPTLAHHFREAEDWPRAAAYALRAAGRRPARLCPARGPFANTTMPSKRWTRPAAMKGQTYCGPNGLGQRQPFKFRPYPEQLERLTRAEQIARQSE
jgi:hypothetical protein